MLNNKNAGRAAPRRLSTTSVIVVAFNSEATLEACLKSVPENCEIVLVDQCSTDNSISVARAARADTKVIRAGANRGFGAGCNLGAANAAGEVLIFLNPDASFCSPESFEILVDAVIRNNALVGPRIVSPTGSEETRARNWSRARSDFAEIFLPAALIVGTLRRDIPRNDDLYDHGGRVPYVQGSCLGIGAVNFWHVNGFDERMFLYHEEETLARKLQTVGIDVKLEAQAVISHIGAHSTSQLRDFAAGQYYRSLALYYLIFSKKWVAVLIIIGLWATLRAMAAFAPLRERIGLRVDKSRTWYRSAAAGVISGWRLRMVDPPAVPETTSVAPK